MTLTNELIMPFIGLGCISVGIVIGIEISAQKWLKHTKELEAEVLNLRTTHGQLLDRINYLIIGETKITKQTATKESDKEWAEIVKEAMPYNEIQPFDYC